MVQFGKQFVKGSREFRTDPLTRARLRCDPARIPRGDYCYTYQPVEPDHPDFGPIDEWGRTTRAVRASDEVKQVLCPYWRRTRHATVCCDFLGREVLDDTEPGGLARAFAHFGGEAAFARHAGYSWELSDEIKVCDVNTPNYETRYDPQRGWLIIDLDEEAGGEPIPR